MNAKFIQNNARRMNLRVARKSAFGEVEGYFVVIYPGEDSVVVRVECDLSAQEDKEKIAQLEAFIESRRNEDYIAGTLVCTKGVEANIRDGVTVQPRMESFFNSLIAKLIELGVKPGTACLYCGNDLSGPMAQYVPPKA